MLILHTADWHLGNTFHGHSREAEHRHFLDWLLTTLRERQPDALLVSGDVFDTPNPPAAAERMYYDFLSAALEAVEGLQIVVTAGNHDSGGRLEAPGALLEARGIYVRGTLRRAADGTPAYERHLVPLRVRGEEEPACVVFALPYLRSGDYAPGLSPEEGLRTCFRELHRHHGKSALKRLPVVVCAHYYAAGADINAQDHSERLVVGGQDRVSPDVAGRAAYVALGHIHKAQPVGEASWYAGSALPMSFSEKHYRHGVLAVTLAEGRLPAVETLPYEPLRALLTLPARGAATPAELLDEISALPRRGKKDEGLTWPYLEIKVRESRPEPQLLHDVAQALQDKAVRFCRMVRETAATARPDDALSRTETLQAISPEDMARRVFRARYGEEMPDEMLRRLKEVLY